MEISKRIIIVFVIVSLIPILGISGIVVNTIQGVSNENANDAAEALKAEELANLRRISNDTGLFIEERMQNYIDGVYMMEDYCEGLFNGRINATSKHNYFWNPALEPEPIPSMQSIPEYDSDYISFEVDCYYMPRPFYRNDDPFDYSPSTANALNISSNMITVYRALHEMSPDYIWLYMGFDLGVSDQHLFRNYPFDNLEYFLGWYDEDDPNYPNNEEDDYDPNTEDWYTNVEDVTDDSITFTGPYGDPSTGLVISIGRPARFDNDSLIGVVSADVTLDTIQSEVLDIEILQNGYAYLINTDGSVVAHKDFTEEGQSIYEVEFGSQSSQEAVDFAEIIDESLVSGAGQVPFTKNGENWYLTYTTMENTGFLLAIVVPESDVIGPAIAIREQVLFQTTILTFGLGGVLALVAVVVAVASYKRAKSVVEPIKEMTRLVEKMSRKDFTRGVTTSGAMYEEIGTTVDALLSFQEACRFGNQAFIRGDLNRALANYQNLLEISQRLNIEVGEQTMYLNIGNVFRQRGDQDNAARYYEKALTLAKQMLDKSKELGEDETDALMRVGSAYHNMALVEMDKGEFDKAMQLLDDAEAIDQSLGNKQGLAKRLDAKGLVLMKAGRNNEAQSQFEQAMQTAQSVGYRRSMAYISYHMGEFYEKIQNLREAENAFNKAIELGKDTDELWLVVYAMKKQADILDLLGKSSHEIRREAERLRRSIMFKKSVIFVIDYSGSMRAQDRIKAAIQGAKEILDSQVNPQDEVSIIVFNDTYREILPLTRKGEYDSPGDNAIHKALDSLRYPNSATAFYDALGKALEELDKIESSEHRWIIALTDGQDNSSDDYSLDAIERSRQGKELPTIEQFIRGKHLDVNLIIIGVGNELKGYIDNVYSPSLGRRITFEELLESVCDNIPQGQYLSVVDSIDVRADIEIAFKEVGVLMAQLEVGGSTIDY